ncbi:hypothetical protein FF38_09241, partial [Lucilia cuprina]
NYNLPNYWPLCLQNIPNCQDPFIILELNFRDRSSRKAMFPLHIYFDLYSDNGTYLVGPCQLLKKERQEFLKHLRCSIIEANSFQNLK